MKKALITGINGQDGSYLSELLLEKGYEVWGILKRNSVAENQTARLDDVFNKINLEYADMLDLASLNRVLEQVKPDEIYNLAAQSHVRISFDQPIYTTQVVAIGTLNILDVVSIVDLILNPQTSIQINSGTSYGECWGYCVFELELDNSNALFTASGWGWYEFPDLLLEDNLNQEMWQQIIELIDFEYFQSLDDVYGCPDCADGGAEFIEIIYDGAAKQVTFDAYTEIDGIQELTILLRDLRAEYWNQINENQACSIMPEVGPCDGICPTYYFNQNTNQCEEFIFGCCGPEAFDTMQGCIDSCE